MEETIRTPIQVLEDHRVVLEHRRLQFRGILDVYREKEDWHGVMDASADLREIDTELAVINRMLEGDWKWR